ncbi:3287_t:CDS:2, partial [Paraglomus occultum]
MSELDETNAHSYVPPASPVLSTSSASPAFPASPAVVGTYHRTTDTNVCNEDLLYS